MPCIWRKPGTNGLPRPYDRAGKSDAGVTRDRVIRYELELTRRVADAVDVPVIASGGAGTLDHLVEAIEKGGADAVLAASIFHYGTYSIDEAKERLRAAGIPVRQGAR